MIHVRGIMEEYKLSHTRVSILLADLKGTKIGKKIMYSDQEVKEKMTVFLNLPNEAPEGMSAKKHLAKHLNRATITINAVLEKRGAPQPKGQYWNGTKLIDYYDIAEVKKWLQNPKSSLKVEKRNYHPVLGFINTK